MYTFHKFQHCFNLSSFHQSIRIHSDCLFVLLLDSLCIIGNSSHTDQSCTGGFFLFTLMPFSSTESLTEYLITSVVWVTTTLYCQCCTITPFHSFKFTSRDFHHAPLTLLSGEVWVQTLIAIYRNLAGILLLLTNLAS